MPDFHQTVMGRMFYEGTMPALVRQLERLNSNIEQLLAADPSGVTIGDILHAMKTQTDKAETRTKGK